MSDEEIPNITLGKKQFPVPEFAWRDVKKLAPMMAKFSQIDFRSADEAQYNALADLVYLAIGRDIGGVKAISREELDALPMTLKEILAAVPVIAKQAGMEKPEEPAEGEALAESTSA